ncbi:hypothetical protein Tco_1269912 [Tanacetum coccineum]
MWMRLIVTELACLGLRKKLDINALALSDRHPTYHETPSDQDEYSKIISEKHVENEENTEIDENGSKSPPYDFEVWKGRSYIK